MTPMLPTASLGKRLAAMLYEALLLFALLFIADYLFIALTRNLHAPWIKQALQFWLLIVMAAYFGWLWTQGQTLPMKTWRIRLVTQDNQKLRLPQALLRFALAFFLFGISQLWAFFDRDRQFLHDRLSGTRLVDDRKT